MYHTMALSERGASHMREEGSIPEMRAQDVGEGRRQGVHGADTAGHDRAAASRRARPALPPIREVLTAALRQRVAQRTARDQRSHPLLVGHSCEQCLAAPAIMVQPAPWGGDGGLWGV